MWCGARDSNSFLTVWKTGMLAVEHQLRTDPELLDSDPSELAARGIRARTHESGRGRYLAVGVLGGVFSPTLSGFSGGLAPLGAPSGFRLRGKEPFRRLPSGFGPKIAIIFRDQGPAIRGQRAAEHGANGRAMRSLYGCSVDREHCQLP